MSVFREFDPSTNNNSFNSSCSISWGTPGFFSDSHAGGCGVFVYLLEMASHGVSTLFTLFLRVCEGQADLFCQFPFIEIIVDLCIENALVVHVTYSNFENHSPQFGVALAVEVLSVDDSDEIFLLAADN